MHTVATVLGPIPIDALGFSLMHEHVLVRGRGGESALTRTRLALMQLRHNYVRTIVDATPSTGAGTRPALCAWRSRAG